MKRIKVVNYGIGVIGKRIIEQLLTKDWIQIVGAIDISKEIIGEDISQILNFNEKLGVKVSNDAETILSRKKPDIVIHSTQSYVEQVFDQLSGIIKHRANVVSTCEELSYPLKSSPSLSKKLDKLAKKEGVTILGTGINPGFLMDYLPIVLTGPCKKVDHIKIIRQINASYRRVSFQKKIGAGLNIDEFEEAIYSRKITGHVGLEQSIGMIAEALQWQLDDIVVSQVEPVVSEEGVSSNAIMVKPGSACGILQKAQGIKNGKEVILLDFRAYLGSKEEYDLIEIKGIPNINQKITPCINGDIGTISMIINSIPRVIKADPGLITMKDLPPPIVS